MSNLSTSQLQTLFARDDLTAIRVLIIGASAPEVDAETTVITHLPTDQAQRLIDPVALQTLGEFEVVYLQDNLHNLKNKSRGLELIAERVALQGFLIFDPTSYPNPDHLLSTIPLLGFVHRTEFPLCFERQTILEAPIPEIANLIQSELGGAWAGGFIQVAQDRLAKGRVEEQIAVIKRHIPMPLEGKRFLEVGSSFSTLQVHLNDLGIQGYGIEPSMEAIQLGNQAWQSDQIRVAQTVGEALPFPNESFDLIFSSNVLEHTQDPAKVIAESLRVLKSGGYLQFVFPNYGSVWDGHYSLPWIPYAPYSLGRFYVSLFGRDPNYVDTLQLLNIFTLRRILANHPEAQVITWGFEIFDERLQQMQFSEWAGMGGVKRIVTLLHQLRLVKFASWVSRQLHLQTPFILTIHKQG